MSENGKNEGLPSEFVVMAWRFPHGERFTAIRKSALADVFTRPAATIAERVAGVERFMNSPDWIEEPHFRQRLTEMGWATATIETAISDARRKLGVAISSPSSFEHITKVGYRNADGQEVVRKTALPPVSGQRVFVMRCSVCGHEYGAYGCDTDIRRRPHCQDGPPGVTLS